MPHLKIFGAHGPTPIRLHRRCIVISLLLPWTHLVVSRSQFRHVHSFLNENNIKVIQYVFIRRTLRKLYGRRTRLSLPHCVLIKRRIRLCKLITC